MTTTLEQRERERKRLYVNICVYIWLLLTLLTVAATLVNAMQIWNIWIRRGRRTRMQAHAAVHAPAARALLHAARVQCVRVKKKLAGVLPWFGSLHVQQRLEAIQSPLPHHTSGPWNACLPAQCLPMHLDDEYWLIIMHDQDQDLMWTDQSIARVPCIIYIRTHDDSNW
jgi:hypothetical protein